MEKDSELYQLMDTRMNSVMNGITNSDGEYQAIIRKSDEYSGRLDGMPLSEEVRTCWDFDHCGCFLNHAPSRNLPEYL